MGLRLFLSFIVSMITREDLQVLDHSNCEVDCVPRLKSFAFILELLLIFTLPKLAEAKKIAVQLCIMLKQRI